MIPERLASVTMSDLSKTKMEKKDSNVEEEIDPRRKNGNDVENLMGTMDENCDDMSPKRMRLAAKVKNLSPSKYAEEMKMKFNSIHTVPNAIETEKNLEDERDLDSENDPTTANATAKSKLNFRNLRAGAMGLGAAEEPKKQMNSTNKHSLRAVVDMETMKSELKQLEDPPITDEDKILSANRLRLEFFDVPCEDLAKNLLGKILVRQLENGTILKGKIVETESYLGGEDKASQSYQNKVTPRNIPMYMPPGTIYVYLTYGMYHCFNISSRGEGSAVLIRALSPIEGMAQMVMFRNCKPTANSKSISLRSFKNYQLSNGPSKFCIAFGLNRDHCKYSICSWKRMWIEDNNQKEDIQIIQCPRIGIDSAGPEWALKPLRFYIFGETSVSKKDKKAEAAFTDNNNREK